MKPRVQEGDILVLIDFDEDWKYWMVQKAEPVVYDQTMSAVTTATLSTSTEITNLEPPWQDEPWHQIYQLRVGVDIGMCYVEMLAGATRRTPYMQRRPTSSAPYVGYFDEQQSPWLQPHFEFFCRYNEKIALSFYNKWGFSITPKIHVIGWKLQCLDLSDARSAKYLNLDPTKMKTIIQRCKDNTIAHRRITMLGIEKG